MRMPAMYLPHGGGPSFFMTGERKLSYQDTEDFLRGIHRTLPATPKAILSVTALVPAFADRHLAGFAQVQALEVAHQPGAVGFVAELVVSHWKPPCSRDWRCSATATAHR